MYPTAELCRTQQAIHRERARSSKLENVRLVAEKAAKAWGIEAHIAEQREARRVHVRETADLIAAQRHKAAIEMLYSPNENPDRGRSTGPAA